MIMIHKWVYCRYYDVCVDGILLGEREGKKKPTYTTAQMRTETVHEHGHRIPIPPPHNELPTQPREWRHLPRL